MLSLSVLSASVSLPFVRFPSASGYLALCFFLSSFFLSPPHSGFPNAPSPLSLPWLSPFLPTWFPVPSLSVLRTRLPVRFLSSLPVSLPQPFHRCFPPALAFGLSPFLLHSFVRFRSASGYSAFCFFLSALPGSASQWLPRCAASALASTVFPVRPGLVSHALLPVLVLGLLFVSFRPTRLRSHSCSTGASLLFRFRFSSGLFCLLSGFFRPLQPASDYSAFCSFFSLLPVFPWQRF